MGDAQRFAKLLVQELRDRSNFPRKRVVWQLATVLASVIDDAGPGMSVEELGELLESCQAADGRAVRICHKKLKRYIESRYGPDGAPLYGKVSYPASRDMAAILQQILERLREEFPDPDDDRPRGGRARERGTKINQGQRQGAARKERDQ